MNSIADVTFSGFIAQNFVEWLKERGWIKSRIGIIVSSTATNLAVQIVMSVADSVTSGQRLSLVLLRAAVGTVVSAAYHDWKKTLDKTS